MRMTDNKVNRPDQAGNIPTQGPELSLGAEEHTQLLQKAKSDDLQQPVVLVPEDLRLLSQHTDVHTEHT